MSATNKIAVAEIPSDKHFVFVAGLHRSGTSLLHRLLASHPSASGFHGTGVPEDEGQHLQSVFPAAYPFGGAGRFGFDARAYMDEHHELATAENARRVFADWAVHWDLERRVLLEKSPTTIIRTRFLQALFPNSSFIILMRHPVAVTCATRKWRPKDPIDRLLEHWVTCYEAFQRDRAFLRRCSVVRYEDLVADPESVMRAAFDFLGLPARPLSEPVRSGVNDAYFREWNRLPRGFWKGRRLARALGRLEPRISQLGYDIFGTTADQGSLREEAKVESVFRAT